MTFRFNTCIEADSLDEAWSKLHMACYKESKGYAGVKNIFSACLLEDGDEDKENRLVEELKQKDEKYHGLVMQLMEKYKASKEELTVREVKDFCLGMLNVDCEECPLFVHKRDKCYLIKFPCFWNEKEIAEIIRGYKPEGEER